LNLAACPRRWRWLRCPLRAGLLAGLEDDLPFSPLTALSALTKPRWLTSAP